MHDSLTTLIPASPRPAFQRTNPPVQHIQDFLASFLILAEDWESLPADIRNNILACSDMAELLPMLVENRLLTEYQAGRIEAGTTFGMVLGNYRVLDRLGAGGMGVVFRAEHTRMRKQVAIKVLPFAPDRDDRILRRFFGEIRTIAQLQHPNIVGAMDAGEVTDGQGNILHFFVMEYIPGQDLEQLVRTNGALSVPKACDLMHQVASALAEAHKHGLVHRDIKPSNIQVTPEGQAKLLDFGLARHFRTGMTEPGTLLGTLDFMAPEQVQDASTVDIRGDLYALGGVLYWCLTGQTPFLSSGNVVQDLAARLNQPPPSLCAKRQEVPSDLEVVLKKLMALRPEDRYATPQAVMRGLLPFLKTELRDHFLVPAAPHSPSERDKGRGEGGSRDGDAPGRVQQVLLVDDEASIRSFCRYILKSEGLECDEADGGLAALEMIRKKKYDLLLLDVNMPDLSGPELCQQLRLENPSPNLKIIMASGNANIEVMSHLLLTGADDFITKPFSLSQLKARIKAALRLKDAQDRNDLLNRHLLTVNHELEQSLHARQSDIIEARNALVLALAKLVEHRASETGAHLVRMQHYVRCLAEEAARSQPFADQIDANFIELLECCAPLHDIGMVGLPDHILLKPGRLDAEEKVLMQTHTVMGAETLHEVAESHGSAMAFLQMAIDIARHHHERYDGAGYPDHLCGSDIPLPARIVAIADVYDALRARRPYKPALSHSATLEVLNSGEGKQFDPGLMQAFARCAPAFERIHKEMPD
jgi:response regulator RpfG family c-di-GMP phosphodiesterase